MAPQNANSLTGRLHRVVNLGAQLERLVEIAENLLLSVIVPSRTAGRLSPPGGELKLSIAAEDVRLLAR